MCILLVLARSIKVHGQGEKRKRKKGTFGFPAESQDNRKDRKNKERTFKVRNYTATIVVLIQTSVLYTAMNFQPLISELLCYFFLLICVRALAY